MFNSVIHFRLNIIFTTFQRWSKCSQNVEYDSIFLPFMTVSYVNLMGYCRPTSIILDVQCAVLCFTAILIYLIKLITIVKE